MANTGRRQRLEYKDLGVLLELNNNLSILNQAAISSTVLTHNYMAYFPYMSTYIHNCFYLSAVGLKSCGEDPQVFMTLISCCVFPAGNGLI